MTVRQAIALSGGYDMVRLRIDNPTLLSADLRGEYESLGRSSLKNGHTYRG